MGAGEVVPQLFMAPPEPCSPSEEGPLPAPLTIAAALGRAPQSQEVALPLQKMAEQVRPAAWAQRLFAPRCLDDSQEAEL